MPMILVSACLAGIPCRYDGRHCQLAEVAALVQKKLAIPICPEKLGGLGAPHPACEIAGQGGEAVLDGKARVIDIAGQDRTAVYLAGAEKTLEIAGKTGARQAWLKSKSPACGYGAIYNGTFSDQLVPGNGVAAALLQRAGLAIRCLEAPSQKPL